MCGISGSSTGRYLSDSLLNKISLSQSHRGPDDSGIYRSVTNSKNNLCLLHQRLAIIDLRDGVQPMTSLDNNLCIVFNGEIFNHSSLRKDLILKGHKFKTDHSDTEVLLVLYKEYGVNLLEYLNGMFAFVIYDKQNDILFGAIDHAGIKPLYFSNKSNDFFFASELKSLLTFGLDKSINPQSLSNYLAFQCVPGVDTIFKNISKLQPGHYFIYSNKNSEFKINKYWKINFNQKIKTINHWKSEIFHKIEESIKTWSQGDVEVGASLSGGVDSSTIVALLSRNNGKKIKTFCLGFDGENASLDERKLAQIVSNKYNTDHYEYILNESEVLRDFDEMIYHLDEPYAGGLPSWFIYKMMKGKIKVALTGTGGDELFGNYNKAKIYSNNIVVKLLKVCLHNRKNLTDALKLFLLFPNGFLYKKYFNGAQINGIMNETNTTTPEEYIEKIIRLSGEYNYKNIIPYVDFQTQLPYEFLQMTDRFSMAHSIEVRTPFLNPDLINLLFSIPPEIRTTFTDPKYLLKNITSNLLPNEILNAQKKGFVIPQDKWLRNLFRDQVEYYLNPLYLKRQGIFNPSIYNLYVVPHMKESQNNHWQIWTLLMFQKWYDRFLC